MFAWLAISPAFVDTHADVARRLSLCKSIVSLTKEQVDTPLWEVFVNDFSVYLCDTLALHPEALPALISEQTYLLVYIEDVQRGIASLKKKDDEVGVHPDLLSLYDLLHQVCQDIDVIDASEAASVMETLGAVFDRTEAPADLFRSTLRILALPSVSAVVEPEQTLALLARYRPLRPLASRPEEEGRETADCDDARSPQQQLCGAKRSHQTDSESDDAPSPLLRLC